MKRLFAVSGIIFAIAGGINAAPPTWWSEGNPPVIDSAAEANNHGVANIGQAKWMAKNALSAVRTIHPATADAIEADLVGSGKPIASWDMPVTQEQKDAQHAPLLTGQLKAIAAPIYSKLHELDAAWLENQLTQNQTKDANDSSNFYPWSSSSGDDDNKAPVVIGQLKAAFSLRFETLTSSATQWFILTGDFAQGITKTLNQTLTIPAGESRVITVMVASDEYPDWTGSQSEFNDILTWDIQSSSGQTVTGNINVNSRHDEWQQAELSGSPVQGFFPVNVESSTTFVAPANAALTVTIQLSATNVSDGILPSTVLVSSAP